MKAINFISAIFIFVVLAGAAFGQSGKVLVPGEPALTEGDAAAIVTYYENGLGIRFTSAERVELHSLIEKNWRETQRSSGGAGLSDFMKTVNALNAWDDAKRARLQDKLREAVLGDLKSTAGSGGMSRYVLDVYEARGEQAASSGPTATEDAPANNAGTQAGHIDDIVGEWVWGRSGGSTYSSGGSLMGSNGSRFTYKFLSNGSVEYTGIMNIMSAGCRMQVFSAKKGRASIAGDTLTIDWAPADFSRDDSCSPAKNYKKKMPAETETFRVRFNDSYGQRQLCLTGKDETCFSPGS
jgi:hypothetical protein